MKKINIGIVGCGNISGIYFKNLSEMFDNTNIYAVADLNTEVAKTAAEKLNCKVLTFEQMLETAEIEIILNLTTPQSHFDICKRTLMAGKNVYVEKPLSLSFENGKELVELAEQKGLMLGCAPDTFLGGGIQTCRQLIDDGIVGDVIGANAFMLCRGHESWHPAPEFYYKKGGGPMFDMGPYYLTALVHLAGQIKQVNGMTNMTFPTRTITSEPLNGKIVDVEVPTHVNGTLRFLNGGIGNIVTSFDVCGTTCPRIEIYGSKRTLIVPDPNMFEGPVLMSNDAGGFDEMPITKPNCENSRGIGVSDMAQCIIEGRTNNKASGHLANHVLEIMCGIHTSSNNGRVYEMTTSI